MPGVFAPSTFQTNTYQAGAGALGGRILINGIDVAQRNVELPTFTPSDSDLGQQIGTASFIVDEDVQVTPIVPVLGADVKIYEDVESPLVFSGRISDLVHIVTPVRRRWRVTAQDWNVRAFETATGSLTYTSVKSDREMVIGIFREAMKNTASSPSGALTDDPILLANEPDWPGVKATALLEKMDFSYMSPKEAMDLVTKYVPNVHWRIGPDLILSYGDLTTPAPFAVSTSPNGTTARAFENYSEQTFIGDHRNKMRRGGAGTAEVTAYDEVSIAKLGRVLEDPYENDEEVPAADIQRRTYAELASRRVKRQISFTVYDSGLKAGQLLDVVNERLGSGTIPAPFMDIRRQLAGRSDYGVLAGERDRFLVQKVRTRPLGRGNYAYDIECGDYVRDLSKGLAKLVRG